MSFSAYSQECNFDQSSLHFDMDECKAIFGFPSQTEYTEFVATADTFAGGSILSVVGDHLYRQNGDVNMHSCTESYNETAAMCVSSLDDCEYVQDSDRAVRFDIMVEPGNDGVGRLSSLSFYEAAPETFIWLNGTSGPNDYPTMYAVRVLVDGVEVYEQIDIETTTDYTLETFDFSEIAAFRVTETTVFNFELISYCTQGLDAPVSVWDLDDIMIFGNAVDNADGGTLAFSDGTTSSTVCTGDGNSDQVSLLLSGTVGTSDTYVITDIDSMIIEFDASFPYNFENTPGGTSLIFNVSDYDGLTNTSVGTKITDIIGCYDLSNSIQIATNEVNGGTLEGGPFEFCVDDGDADNIPDGSISLSGNIGTIFQWIVTDTNGNILGNPANYSNVNFDIAGVGNCLIYNLSSFESVQGVQVGNNISDITGCFELSNAIQVVRNERPNVTISSDNTLCGEDNGSATANGNSGQAPYSYVWSNGTSTANNNGLAPGNYTVTVTDANGCTNWASVTIDGSTAPTPSISAIATSCGNSNGSATASSINGTAPYTYNWSNGDTGTTITGLASGDYTVTVTDANGCTGSQSTTIDASTSPDVTFGVEDTSCGEDNGSATAFVEMGTAPYTYLWSQGATTATISGLEAGVYTVTVTDDVGCTDVAFVDIEDSTSPEVSASATETSCGEDNGSVTTSVSFGVTPYSYNWSNGSTDANLVEVAAGAYTVTVTDAFGCTDTSSVEVDDSSSPMVNISSTDTSCGMSNGSATASATDGVTPYSYSWSNGASTAMISDLESDMYTVTVTDALGCTGTSSVNIADSDDVELTVTSTETACGFDNGTATAMASSGTAPYTYAWSTGESTATITGLPADDYSVTVTDAAGCTAIGTTSISESVSPEATADSTPTTCGLDNGSATVSAMSGTGLYTYLWSNGASEVTIQNLSAGSYTVTVTDEAGCTATATTVVEDSDPITVSVMTTGTTCGEENGTAWAIVEGSPEQYTYLWSNGSTSVALENLSAGTYSVTITNSEGCTANASGEIQESTNVQVSTDSENTTCGASNGTASATATQGLQPYTFAWSNGDTGNSISNLAAGSYSVTVTDSQGCTAVSTSSVEDSTSPMISIDGQDSSCGNDNGSALATVTAGISPYTFEWSNGSTTNNIDNLGAGNYTVTVTDAVGCTATGSVSIADSDGPSVSLEGTDTMCGQNNGTANSTVNGGLAPFTYLWSSGSTEPNIMGLEANDYSLTVTDANGCTAVGSITIADSNMPSTLVVATNTSCGQDNGTASAGVFGGVEPYTYLWSTGSTANMITGLPAGSYSVTITDAVGCTAMSTGSVAPSSAPIVSIDKEDTVCGDTNGSATANVSNGTPPYTYLWSNGLNTPTIQNLSAGSYSVTITDDTGCTASATTNIDDSPSLEVDASAEQTTCGENNGTATADTEGGTAPYNYIWSTGATTQMIMGLEPGVYQVTVTDANGCTDMAMTSVLESTNPEAMVSVTDTSCGDDNGEASVSSISGGVMPYTYLWSTGSTQLSISNLAAGSYSVTVTDAEGCTSENTVSVQNSDSPMANIETTQPTCGENNGSLTVNVNGGVTPYTYAWSVGSTNVTLENLGAGTYTVTVTDAVGCTSESSSTLNTSEAVDADASATDTTCGENNGTATADATGGVAPYTYQWSTGATTQMIMGLEPNDYMVTITDAAGCTDVAATQVEGSANPTILVGSSPSECGEPTGAVTVSIDGGTPPYDILWSTGDMTQMVFDLVSGTYAVTVTDSNGCSATGDIDVEGPQAPEGGMISGAGGVTSYEFCLEGTMDMIAGLNVSGASGSNMAWIITDADGVIKFIFNTLAGINEYDFDDSVAGTCLIYHISYEEIENIIDGTNVNELEGCFDLSNEITVVKNNYFEGGTSSVLFDMEMCAASISQEQHTDYSEFTANISNSEGCTTIDVIGGNLYRNNPLSNPHSCTDGTNGGIALCVSSEDGCDYLPNSELALKVDIEIEPASEGSSTFSELSFFEKAPEEFVWLNGANGPNDYPTLFGIRVLKDGVVVYEESDIETEREWNQRSFDFAGDDFIITETTVYSIELLAYCTVDNGGFANAWDIDELMIVTTCDNTFAAGDLDGGPYDICHDGIPDFITDVTLNGNFGAYTSLVLVDDQGLVAAVFSDLEELASFDFEMAPIGTCNLYSLAGTEGLSGVVVGNAFKSDFNGCFEVSEPIVITKEACGTIIETYPNPTSAYINIANLHMMKGAKEIFVYNSVGQIVIKKRTSSDVIIEEVDLTSLRGGLYTIKVISNSGSSTSLPIMKVE